MTECQGLEGICLHASTAVRVYSISEDFTAGIYTTATPHLLMVMQAAVRNAASVQVFISTKSTYKKVPHLVKKLSVIKL